ncbi:TPA: hypothetical protein CPT80_06330 [Candidatus Gastranaerophilales bacterium HUM_9]|nr:MAG TPA: hypothetical protein CPT80_06330 [Candidatus Gastranaerophilales bacterium HUM_9]HBX34336.1 hypothetical protein [Cyanobacteria bacterium UBA11440]
MKLFYGMSAQKKLIITGLFFSTLLLFLISALAVFSIKDNLNMCYKYFGQVISKSLAIETVSLTRGLPKETIYNTLRTHSISIIETNEDMAFIEFKDSNSEVIYSTKNDGICSSRKSRVTVSSPLVVFQNGSPTAIGSVTIGLTGSIVDEVSSMTRLSLAIAFLIAWLTIALIIIMNTLIATKELRTLCDGVRKLSSGEFGYKINSKGVSKEAREVFKAFNNMSEKLHLYNESSVESLMLERNKFEAILMSIVNGVIVCDNNDRVVLVNEHAKQMLEVTDDEIINTNLQQYCDSNGIDAFEEKIKEFKNTPINQMVDKPLEFNIEVADKIFKTVISPMFLSNGDYVGYIVVLIDFTKEEEMNKMRSQFISNVSHELRTPVTVLRSYIDTLYTMGDEFDLETQKEFIGIMNKEIIRLHDMVNDILDFSRYQAKNVHLDKEMSDVSKLIQECVDRANVLAEEKEISIIVMIEPNLPQIPINYDSITRVIMNLLTNAIKYSPKGKKVKIKVEKVKEYLEISVEDEGIGISEENQKKVFDRFFRVENKTHTVKGTGLGLHLVKVAVEKHHHGKVFVKSKLNEGSTFGIMLPIKVEAEELV